MAFRPETLDAIVSGKCYIGVAEVSKDGTFLKVNDRYAEILGYSVFELENRIDFQRVTYIEDLDADLEQARMVARGEIVEYPMIKRYRNKEGDLVKCKIFVKGIYRGEPSEETFSHYAVQCEALVRIALPKPTEGTRMGHRGFMPFRWIRENWQILAAGSTAIGLIVAEVIRQLGRGQG